MKNPILVTPIRLIGISLLALAIFVSIEQKTFAVDPPTDPTHAAHVAAGLMPPDAALGDPALLRQLSQLQAKVALIEATLAKSAPPMGTPSAGAPMPGMSTATPAPAMNMGMDKMKPSGGMSGMSATAAPAGGMMGMMDKMMSMGSAPMPGGGMGMDKMEMSGMGGSAMPAGTPAAGMSSGGMGMEKMEMAKMMGMGTMSNSAANSMSQSALPGFPGASHLYHIGATDFFLDHPQHISLTTEQQAALNKAKEQALLAKNTADRAIQQAEQELWTLTAAEQPEITPIQAKVAAIEKLSGDARLRFISAVGDAAKILSDEQRKILTGFAPPVSAAPMAGGMKGM